MDKAIDEQIDEYVKEGRIETPAGEKVSVLMERRLEALERERVELGVRLEMGQRLLRGEAVETGLEGVRDVI